jgi:hypothetical protein
MSVAGVSSMFGQLPQSLRDLLRAQLRIASDAFDLLGGQALTSMVKAAPMQMMTMARHTSCCTIPPPCWMPEKLCDVVSLVSCGGTATVVVRVRNCGVETHAIEIVALPLEAGAAPAVSPTVTPAKVVLEALQQATVTVTLAVPDSGKAETLAFNVFIVGCRRHYFTWTVKTGAVLKSSAHEIEIADCADQLHHWYDHFYCPRPCPGRIQHGGVVGGIDHR